MSNDIKVLTIEDQEDGSATVTLDLDAETYSELFLFSRKVAFAIEKVIPCNRVGLTVIGLEVPHAHVHLIPLNNMQDASFSKPKIQITTEEFSSLAHEISKHVKL